MNTRTTGFYQLIHKSLICKAVQFKPYMTCLTVLLFAYLAVDQIYQLVLQTMRSHEKLLHMIYRLTEGECLKYSRSFMAYCRIGSHQRQIGI